MKYVKRKHIINDTSNYFSESFAIFQKCEECNSIWFSQNSVSYHECAYDTHFKTLYAAHFEFAEIWDQMNDFLQRSVSDCSFNLIEDIVENLLDLHNNVNDDIKDDLLSFTLNLFIIYFEDIDQWCSE